MADHEKRFQNAFVAGLQKNGWIYSGSEGCPDYDKGSAIIPSDLKKWILSTQANEWNQLVIKAGNEINALKLMVEEITNFRKKSPAKGGGTYNLLLHGMKIRNIKFTFFQNKPVSLVSPKDLWDKYDNMILRVVSELYYSHTKPRDAIDLGFFINGIPLGTSELKSILGGQGVGHAEKQYKNDRIPGQDLILNPSAGALFHIAAANNLASLTTALNGKETYFIPFNTGIDNTEWHNAHKKDGYSVSYLWQDVLKKENICQIIFTTMRNIEVSGIWQTRFPRYHQFDNLRVLVQAVMSANGNKNYLSQHAPGSGKSDEIANLAYALSNLQNDAGEEIYTKVIVVTNRTVLDDQLNKLITAKVSDQRHFKHIHKDDDSSFISKSKLLSDQLVSAGGSRILAVTAQTFSDTLLTTIQGLRAEGKKLTGRFAIIVDEAHDGETGRQHQNMYRALLGVSLDDLTAESIEETPEEKAERELSLTNEEERKELPSLNFFAYTATPNADALLVFGEPVEDGEGLIKYKPFHSYSMHQAREEGYINDVLENYVTHDRYVNIELDGKEYKGDKIVNFASAKRQVGEWLQTQPGAKRDIVDIIMKKMVSIVVPSLKGEGKAMLTCSSRVDAVIYKRMIDEEIAKLPKEKQFGTLVAFSGSVYDPTSKKTVTELDTDLNQGLEKKDIAVQFDDNKFRLLIVADKYQVGFDQPKLICMFLDKSLRGISLVQTTARVNRKIKGKDHVYIFDFVNNREDVQDSFNAFDEDATLALDQNLSVDTLEKLKHIADSTEIHSASGESNIDALDFNADSFDIENDVEGYEKAVNIYNSLNVDEKTRNIASMLMSSIIDKCVTKFHKDLEDPYVASSRVEELHRYRIALKRFVSIYNLISITRDDVTTANVLYGNYGGYATFFSALSKALVVGGIVDPTVVDVNALRLKDYKITETGSVVRDKETEVPDITENYTGSLILGPAPEKMGPIEVLINEINGYAELTRFKIEEINDFVLDVVNVIKDDVSLREFAMSNNEEAFVASGTVKTKIMRQLSRAIRSKSPTTHQISKELIKKQEHDQKVIHDFATMLHKECNKEVEESFEPPVLQEPIYVERNEHKGSSLRVHHLADAGYLYDGMPLVSTDDRFPVEGAVIKASAIYVNGLSHPDPSKAANRVRRSFGYMEDDANGWYFWGVKDGNGTVVPLGDLLDKI